MRAAVITAHGGPEVLQITDLPEPPAPGPGEARVRIRAVALNRLDLFVREGWPALKIALPHITCADGAGVVEAVGEGVTSVAPGDRVGINPTIIDPACLSATGTEDDCLDAHILGEFVPGVAAEIVSLPARNLIRLPDDFGFAEAAASGLVFLTAWHSLIRKGGLRAGETVLVVGAGGGVNSASIQIARLAGATVYAVASSAEKCAQALELGAHHVINRAEDPNWSRTIYRLTDKRGVDVVVDNVGAATLFDSIRSVTRGGRILIVGSSSGPELPLDVRYIFSKQISLVGSTMGSTRDFHAVMPLLFEGRLRPVIGARLPLADIRRGHELLAGGSVFGKIVLELP